MYKRQADTYVKTTDSGYDGTLTWIVMVTMDKNATKYTITDNMPEEMCIRDRSTAIPI